VAPTSEWESTAKKKQPPKTKPKPKTSVAVAARSSIAVKPAGDDVCSPSEYVVHSAGDQRTDTVDGTSLSNSTTIVAACKASLCQPNNVSRDDPIETMRVSARNRDIVHPPVRHSVQSRWSSTSCLQSNAPATHDVKEAINRAKQKRVLQRLVGMNLTDESLKVCEAAASDHCDVMNRNRLACASQTCVQLDMPSEDMKPFGVSLGGESSSRLTDHGPTLPHVTSEPNLLADVQNDVTERSTDSTTVRAPLTDERPRRPLSLYPQDVRQQQALLVTNNVQPVTDARLSISTDDNSTQSLPPLRNAQQENPLTKKAANVTPAEHTQVATSRKSCLAVTEFVLENFSETQHKPVDASDCADVEQTVAKQRQTTSGIHSADQANSAATAETCVQDSEKEQTTEMRRRSKRPKSLVRKSIILPNGEILEIVTDAFMFLDDYDEQSDDCAC